METETEARVIPQPEEHEQELPQNPPLLPPRLVMYLYVGYFLARWGARMWEFSVALYMIHLWPNSLLLAAIYGAVESGSTALFGPIVGQRIEGMDYIKVLRLWLVSQNLSFLLMGGSVIALLGVSDLKSHNIAVFITLVVSTNVAGAIGVLSTLSGTILIERDWAVVMSEGHPPEVLTKMNSVIRGIDLSSKLLAPVLTGLIISFVSLMASAITFAAWAIITVWIEYWLFISVYRGVPAIVQSNERRCSRSHTEETEGVSVSVSVVPGSEELTASRNRSRKVVERISESSFVTAWKVYLKQQVVLPGVALALLFFTVLSFGTLMTATLQWEGIPAYIIGIGRGVSATVGLAATVVYPIMQSRLSTLRTGLWSIWSQWSCLLVCVGSIWVGKRMIGAYMLMGGVAASRLGLWMFDLAVIQQMQDMVPESDRCVVGGVQNSLQSALDLMGYLLGIIVSDPQEFWILTMISVSAVTAAGMIYTVHLYRIRKHIFHFDKILGPNKCLD
ncbi:PREDICTED: solute carrier family 40 member 1 [Tarenaya hassleriana]|uniref:solute carrier family 40 member 1 n=1 Tax=Tarenaya hassleriana TaxID=28532 RepID=UPI00053C952A|nr:PREDICTED: solute carrier family 40 member 1 [Tarenaya hassleriana]